MTSSAAAASPRREFLVFFVHRHFAFRYAELDAVLTLQGLSFRDVVGVDAADLPDPETSPVLRVFLPSIAHAQFLSARGILVKGVYEVWGHADGPSGYDVLVTSVAAFNGVDKTRILADSNVSWCIGVDAFGRKLSMADQEARRMHFDAVLPFPGPVNVRAPDEKFLILEEYGVDGPTAQTTPRQLYFLRELAGSERNRGRGGARDLVDQQTLKKRAYIGPTSMESEMALLMTNMALVQRGDAVIDPFVGTGSVLVPCATHGAVCFGTDIDIRVLLGTGVGVSGAGADSDEARVNVLSNFKQYGLPAPELVRADNSQSPLITRCADFFDAVVCDPPYGIRAGARKSGRKPGTFSLSTEELAARAKAETYIPPTQQYAAEDVMRDLLTFAAATLRVGGRLVYLLPTTYEYTDADLPRHPQLRVIHNSEQKLTKKYARRLITMVKLDAPVTETADESHDDKDDRSYANLREKILAENRKRKAAELDTAEDE